MNEEIDVSGCKYYIDSICYLKKYFGESCSKNLNCYYKQLKRLKSENTKLKEMLSKEPKAMQAFQIAYSGLKKDNEVLWGMVKDYKTALEEIREIHTTCLEFKFCENCKFLKICSNMGTGSYIVNKINEVLKNE